MATRMRTGTTLQRLAQKHTEAENAKTVIRQLMEKRQLEIGRIATKAGVAEHPDAEFAAAFNWMKRRFAADGQGQNDTEVRMVEGG